MTEELKKYYRNYYKTHKKRVTWFKNRWRNSHGQFYRDWARDYKQRINREMINAYGGKCTCCSERNPRFMTLDHINGGGLKEFKKYQSSHAVKLSLKRRGWPKKGYTILCYNCNMGRDKNKGVCPHND